MGAIGRLIFTVGMIIVWPNICALEIQLTNEMIQALYSNAIDQGVMLDLAMASTVQTESLSSAANAAKSLLIVVGCGGIPSCANGISSSE